MPPRGTVEPTPSGVATVAVPEDIGSPLNRACRRIFSRALLLALGVGSAWVLAAVLNGPSAHALTAPPAVALAQLSNASTAAAPVTTRIETVRSVTAARVTALPVDAAAPTVPADPIASAVTIVIAVATVGEPVLDHRLIGGLIRVPVTPIAPVAATGPAITTTAPAIAAPVYSNAPITAHSSGARHPNRPAAAGSTPGRPTELSAARPPLPPQSPLRGPVPVAPVDGATTSPGGSAGPSTGSRDLDLATSGGAAGAMRLARQSGVFTDFALPHMAADPSFAPD